MGLLQINEILVKIDTWPKKSSESVHPAEMRNSSEVEADVRASISQTVPEISEVTHVTCHYEEGLLSVAVEFMVNDALTVSEAKQIAGKGRAAILGVEGVSDADVHLELFGGQEFACSKVLRNSIQRRNSFNDL